MTGFDVVLYQIREKKHKQTDNVHVTTIAPNKHKSNVFFFF